MCLQVPIFDQTDSHVDLSVGGDGQESDRTRESYLELGAKLMDPLNLLNNDPKVIVCNSTLSAFVQHISRSGFIRKSLFAKLSLLHSCNYSVDRD